MVQAKEWTLHTPVGTYRVFELVAAGAFGRVYYGLSLFNNTPVAVKQLHAHHGRDPRIVDRFEREAPLVRQLAHPNIVRVVDQGRDDDGLPFIILEWVTGWTLDKLISERGARPPGEAAEIVCQVLDGLEAARLQGVVHRDIKPLNLMVTADGRVKVMDFGIAKESDLAAVSGNSGTFGTPAYMAPERFRGEPADTRTDLYAVGLTLYEVLTGRRPFQADTLAGYMYHHLQTPPPPLASVRPGINPLLATIVERALAKDPAERFATPAEMCTALRPFATAPVTTPAGPPPDPSATQPLTHPSGPAGPPAVPLQPVGENALPNVTAGAIGTGPVARAPQRVWLLIIVAALALLFGGYVMVRGPLLGGGDPAAGPTPTVVVSNSPGGPTTVAVGNASTAPGANSQVCQQGLGEADGLIRRQAWTEAVTKLEAVRSPHCDVTALLFAAQVGQANALAEDERTLEAIAAFDRALGIKSDGEVARARELATAYRGGREALERRAWLTAIDLLTRVHLTNPAYARGNVAAHLINAYLGQGDEQIAQRRPCDALAPFQSAAALRPNDQAVANRLTTAQSSCDASRVSPTTAPAPVAPPLPKPQTPDPEQMVRGYYQAIDQRRYRDAYNFLSRAAQVRQAYPDFERQFSETLISIGVRLIDGVSFSGSSGSLAAHTTTVSAVGTRQAMDCWRVQWSLVLEDGQWKREGINQVSESC